MSVTVPTTWDADKIDRMRFAPGKVIREDYVDGLISAQNYVWSRVGFRCMGLVFSDGNGPASTTSTSYTQAVDGPVDYDLDNWMGVFVPQRRTFDGVGARAYGYEFVIHGRYVHVQAIMDRYNLDGTRTASISTATASTTSGNSEWVSVSTFLAEATWHSGASTANDLATIGCYIQFKAETAQTGELNTWAIYELVPTATNAPTS